MPLYEFRCRKCRAITTTFDRTSEIHCELCKVSMGRVFSFRAPIAFQPHYNVSVGRYVNSQREFNEALKDKSDEATERTGIYHNYVPVDMADNEAFGRTDEGMEDYFRTQHDSPTAPEYAD